MKKVFEYLIIHRPKAKSKDDVAPEPSVVSDVTRVLASDEKEALLHAARGIPSELSSKLDEVEIALRPF